MNTPPPAQTSLTGLIQFHDQDFLTTFFKDQILGELVRRLLKMEKGTPLPSERDLALDLGISRTALRDRIARLSSMGIVSKKEREKTVFSGIQPDALGDFLLLGLLAANYEIYSLVAMRKSLEIHAAVLLTRLDDPDLSEVEAALADINTSTGKDLIHADTTFHLGFLKAAGLKDLFFFWHALDEVFQNTHNNLDYESDLTLFREKHQKYFDAMKAKDLCRVLLAIDDHFDWLIELLQRKGF